MAKWLVLAAVVGLVFWLMFGRRRGNGNPPPTRRPAAPPDAAPQAMVACARCGVHLPRPDASFDAGGHPYCSDAHRLQGPR